MLTTLLINRLLVNIAYMKIWVHLTFVLHSKKLFCATVRFTQIFFFKTIQIYFIFLQNTIVWCLSNLNCLIFHFT